MSEKILKSPRLDYGAIRLYIEKSSKESIIMIGCDSIRRLVHGKSVAKYSTVVCIRNATGTGKDVIYRGSKVFGGSVTLPDYGVVNKSGKIENLKQRMLKEVEFALEAFEKVRDVIGGRHVEIHLDINPNENYQSNQALAEARGYVMGMTGMEPEFKPYALAASFAADAHVRGLI